MAYPKLVENLINNLTRLPGVGRRSAERMVFWFLNNSREDAQAISDSILRLKMGLSCCPLCNNLSEQELCAICSDPSRDQSVICVVEEHKHLLAIERTGTYKGLYYVLLGSLSPAEGRGPDDIKLSSLLAKARDHQVREIVIATDPDTEGEMTALFLADTLKAFGVKVSRIGLGIPVGSSVEYADMSTLAMSMLSRREMTVRGDGSG